MIRFSQAFIAVAAGLLVQTASAADLPVKAKTPPAPLAARAYNWSGFYLGGHVGYMWGRTGVVDDGVVTETGARTNGTIGGVLGGYNWQFGQIVLGLEGDFGWTNAHGSGEVAPPPPPPPVVIQLPNLYDVHWTSRARLRAGYALDNWLFYVAGGYAVADFTFAEGGTVVVPGVGGRLGGWSAGGGVETAVLRNLVGRIEYLYDDFGHKDYVGSTGDNYRVNFTAQTVRGALIWKFD